MSEHMNEQQQEEKVRQMLRRHYDSDKAFLEVLRSDFKKSIKLELKPGRTPLHHHVVRWRYGLIAALIGLSSMAGMMAYADASNVPPTHPLYQFKRMSEQIRLDFSTPQQQVQLHQNFAQRRVQEIQEMKEASESTEVIQNLTNDFQKEADQTLDQAKDLNFQEDKRQHICDEIMKSVGHTLQAQKLVQIQTRCQSFSQ